MRVVRSLTVLAVASSLGAAQGASRVVAPRDVTPRNTATAIQLLERADSIPWGAARAATRQWLRARGFVAFDSSAGRSYLYRVPYLAPSEAAELRLGTAVVVVRFHPTGDSLWRVVVRADIPDSLHTAAWDSVRVQRLYAAFHLASDTIMEVRSSLGPFGRWHSSGDDKDHVAPRGPWARIDERTNKAWFRLSDSFVVALMRGGDTEYIPVWRHPAPKRESLYRADQFVEEGSVVELFRQYYEFKQLKTAVTPYRGPGEAYGHDNEIEPGRLLAVSLETIQDAEGNEWLRVLTILLPNGKIGGALGYVRDTVSMASLSESEFDALRQWSDDVRTAVLDSRVLIGMTQAQVRASWGAPTRKSSMLTSRSTVQIWMYGLERWVAFEDGLVVQIVN